jgi:tetratricopeptide (TPR) repeat protein
VKILAIIISLIILSFNVYCNSLDDIIDNTIRYDKWDEAKIQLEGYLKENPADARAFSLYSTVLNDLKLYDQAINAMKNAINYELSNEKKGEYYFDLGKYYSTKKLNDIALEMYNKSLNLNSTLAETYYMIGKINYENKEIDKCFENWKKYIGLTSNTDKKKKLQMIIDRYENEKAEAEKLLAEQKLKAEEEKKRLAEEQRKKEELLKELMKELEGDKADSKSLDENKIKNDKTNPDIEDIK